MTFTPATDIPDLSNRVIIVTGGNNGIGKETVKQLALHNPARLYLAARTKAKYSAALEEFKAAQDIPIENIVFLPLDLASFSSVQEAAKQVKDENDRLDILINNAGIMGALPSLTKDGYETHFGTNHMGHAYLTLLLLPLLLSSAKKENSDVRIINVTSQGEQIGAARAPFNPDLVKTEMASYHSYTRYGQSKFANILFTRSLASRYPSLKVAAIHPGRVRTPLLDGMFSRSTLLLSPTSMFQRFYDFFFMTEMEDGAKNSLWAATSSQVKSGTYYEPVGKVGGESKLSHSTELADKLWNWQDKEFKKFESSQAKKVSTAFIK